MCHRPPPWGRYTRRPLDVAARWPVQRSCDWTGLATTSAPPTRTTAPMVSGSLSSSSDRVCWPLLEGLPSPGRMRARAIVSTRLCRRGRLAGGTAQAVSGAMLNNVLFPADGKVTFSSSNALVMNAMRHGSGAIAPHVSVGKCSVPLLDTRPLQWRQHPRRSSATLSCGCDCLMRSRSPGASL